MNGGPENLSLLEITRDHLNMSVFSTYLGGGIKIPSETGICMKSSITDSRFMLTVYML